MSSFCAPGDDELIAQFVDRQGGWDEQSLLQTLATTQTLLDDASPNEIVVAYDLYVAAMDHLLSIFALGWLATAEARTALTARLNHPRVTTRWPCALGLGIAKDARAWPYLENMLSETYPVSAKFEAIQPPLATWTPQDTFETEEDSVEDYTDWRILAVDLLTEGNPRRCAPALRTALHVALASERMRYLPGLFAMHRGWVGFYEPRLVYGLGEVGAVGALTGLEGIEGMIPREPENMDTGTHGRLAMWRVHLALGALHAHKRLTLPDDSLHVGVLWNHNTEIWKQVSKQLERLFGLGQAECDKDLAAYDQDLLSTTIWGYHHAAQWRQQISLELGRPA